MLDRHKSIARRAVTVAALALLWLGGGCKAASDPDCVSVGDGWRACSADSQARAELDKHPPMAADRREVNVDAGRATQAVSVGVERSHDAGIAPVLPAAGVVSTAGTGTSASSAGGRAAESGSAGTDGSAGTAGRAAAGSTSGTSGSTVAAGGAGGSAAGGGAPAVPTTCCHALGVCVEAASLEPEPRSRLRRDSCPSEAQICTPTTWLAFETLVPKPCRSVQQLEGRCLPDCVASLIGQETRFPRDVCDTFELCAPCFDPITGESTGSCQLGSDPGPIEPAATFVGCCIDDSNAARGLCVPKAYVPIGAVAPQADCAADLHCVPRERLAAPQQQPVRCNADIRGSGICLAQCIADALAPIVTVQAGCAAGDACFPCQLGDGSSTGACESVQRSEP